MLELRRDWTSSEELPHQIEDNTTPSSVGLVDDDKDLAAIFVPLHRRQSEGLRSVDSALSPSVLIFSEMTQYLHMGHDLHILLDFLRGLTLATLDENTFVEEKTCGNPQVYAPRNKSLLR